VNAHDLDDPIGAGLRTSHAQFAEQYGLALRYRPDVSPFCSVGGDGTAAAWADLRRLLDSSSGALFVSGGFQPPTGWNTLLRIPLTQMVYMGEIVQAPPTEGVPDQGVPVRALGAGDVPEMLRLVSATEPGPFAHSTFELGGYVGIFDDDQLVAMAGRRMNPPGFVEVSAVCTDPDYRGRGYARTLMLEVMRGIMGEGRGVFLHVAHGNPARALYEDLGFVARRDFDVVVVEPAQAA
jgi:ribosomal protein S18 acetylase RimI-like enzyme